MEKLSTLPVSGGASLPRLAPHLAGQLHKQHTSQLMKMRTFSRIVIIAAVLHASLPLIFAQSSISRSAYRVLGQVDLLQNGLNRVEGVELNAPGAVALDARGGLVHLYISDSGNNRILAWSEARSSQVGDPPDVVLGQPDARRSGPLGIGATGLRSPGGMAVDPNSGNLYVADAGNHRVLRFPSPFANPSRVEPDMVYGQPSFRPVTANTGGIGSNSMSSPLAVAFDPAGNLWVADTGNHRVLRFSAGTLDSDAPAADLVMGQKDFTSNGRNRSGTLSASGLDTPAGLAFDAQGNLYISDFANGRVLRFAPPFNSQSAATGVFGQAGFSARSSAPGEISNLTLAGPGGLSIAQDGNLYVAVPAENRILVFASSAGAGSPAINILGQSTFTSSAPNAGAAPRAAAFSLSSPADVKVDPYGNVYVADTGNHRTLSFKPNSRSASQVWGQIEFTANGPNQIKPGSINTPYKIIIDYSSAPYALYVADSNNHRILAWKDSVRFRNGDPADFIIGQPDMRTALPNVDSPSGKRPSQGSLLSPRGMAVDAFGNLYVADYGNNRVLRYPRPTDQRGRIMADAVIGQPDFTSALFASVSASSLRQPSAVAIGPDGSLFVADTGNNRVLHYAPGAGTGAIAIRVFGQPGFYTGDAYSAVSPQTLLSPTGIAVDPASNLYVADYGANRVLIFTNATDAPAAGASALAVIGNDQFGTVLVAGAGDRRFQGPLDLALASTGEIYVSDSGNNRVLVFPSLIFLPISGGAATAVIGQRDFAGTARNWDSLDGRATANSLFSPVGIYLDRRDTLYVGDTGNNRVVHFLKFMTVSNDAFAQASTVARGAIATIQGQALSGDQSAVQPPLAYSLANREVVIDDEIQSPLFSVSPDKISLQVPSSAPLGQRKMAVRVSDTAELIAGSVASISMYSPGIFTRVQNQDGSDNSSTNPASRGSRIRLTGTGQGPVAPPPNDGEAAAEGASSTVAVPTSDGPTCLNKQPSVCVSIGATTFGNIQFSGLAGGSVGVWQIDVTIPQTASAGAAIPVRALINGIPSNIVAVAIK